VLLVPAVLGFGACAKDICKSKDLPREQLCNCQPKDNELLARLQSTELPYPVRRTVIRCAHDIHNSSQHNVVTKQALRDCTNADSALNKETKESLTGVINRSNLMEQKELDDWHAQCLANLTSPTGAGNPPPGTDPAAATSPTPTAPGATPTAPGATPPAKPAP
jgi:hypothetical protein